jgi:hypothetical protein
MGLDHLGDGAVLYARTVAPALGAAEWLELGAAIAATCERLRVQGRIARHGSTLIAQGHGLLIAWEEDAALSGCSRDTIARALASCPGGAARILEAPPLLVEAADGPRALDREGARALIRAGALGASSAWYDLRLPTLGEWRRLGRTTLASSDVGRRLLAGAGANSANSDVER